MRPNPFPMSTDSDWLPWTESSAPCQTGFRRAAGDFLLGPLDLPAAIETRKKQLPAVRGDAPLAIWMANSPEMVLTMLAAWVDGRVVAPVGFRWPLDRAVALADSLGASHLATANGFLELRRQTTPGLPEGAGTVLFTSGSSGFPKAVYHSLGHHLASARAASERIPLKPGDGWLLSLPLHHVSGLGILMRCLCAGADIVFPDSVKWGSASLEASTHLSLVSVQLRRLLEDGTPLCGLKAVLGGGGPFDREIIRRAVAARVPLHLTYGMTETASQIATTAVLKQVSDPLHSGHPLPGVELRCGPDGILQCRAPGLSPLVRGGDGIFRNPARNDGWFATGDTGFLTPAGEVVVTGRRDRLMISGGENIQPEFLERLLQEHPLVRRAAVVAVPHPAFGERPVAFVSGGADEAELKNFLSSRCESFAIPDEILPWPDGVDEDAPKLDFPQLARLARMTIL